MGSLHYLVVRTSNIINAINSNNRWNALTTIARAYSVFPSSYHRPIFKRAEQEEIKGTDVGRDLAHSKIKPASSFDTCSEFDDPLINKFVNYIMRDGKKAVARDLMDNTLLSVKSKQLAKYRNTDDDKKDSVELDPKTIVHQAVANAAPVLQLTKISKGGITYQIPIPVTEQRGLFLAMNWLILAAKEKDKNTRFYDALATQLIAAYDNKGPVIKKKQELHKQCEANRAYAHFRWQKRL